MTVIQLAGHQHAEYQVDRFAVGSVEIDGFGKLDEGGATEVDVFQAAVRKRCALVETGTAEALAIVEAAEDYVAGNIRIGAGQQLAEDLQAVFLAPGCGVTKYAVRLDDFFEQHWVGLGGSDLCGRGPHRSLAVLGVLDFLLVSGVVINELFFVLSYSSFNLVHKTIDRCVHVLFGMIGIDRTTIYANSCFSFVPEFFDGQNTMDVRHEVKVTSRLINLGFDIFS